MAERITGKIKHDSQPLLRRVLGQKFEMDAGGHLELNDGQNTIWLDAGYCVVPNEEGQTLEVTRYGITEQMSKTVSVHFPYEGQFKVVGRSFRFEARRVK